MTENKYQNDLKLNRNLIVKVKSTDKTTPKVVEINFNLYAVPKETKIDVDYVQSVEKIRKRCIHIFNQYTKNNPQLFREHNIIDFNFTTANLKCGYNKYVTMSCFLRQKQDFSFEKIQREIRKTLKETTNEIVDTLRTYGFNCYKQKH